jgi:hypothetical protein
MRAFQCSRQSRTELERVLNWPPEKRGELLRRLIARQDPEHLATLMAMADADEVVRLRPLRDLAPS